MITSAASRVSEPNPAFVELKRRRGDDNLAWLRKLLSSYTPQGVVMLLIGGTDALAFRLRVAQAHLRNDMTPSWWSHIALVLETSARDIGRSRLVEISLDPAGGFGWAPTDNAVQSGVSPATGTPVDFRTSPWWICLRKRRPATRGRPHAPAAWRRWPGHNEARYRTPSPASR
jgi:hypothetical protein